MPHHRPVRQGPVGATRQIAVRAPVDILKQGSPYFRRALFEVTSGGVLVMVALGSAKCAILIFLAIVRPWAFCLEPVWLVLR